MKKIVLLIGILLSGTTLAEFSGTVFLNSDYRLYGASQTQEDPALQLELVYATENNFVFGTFLSNVDLGEGTDTSIELDLFASYEFALNEDNAMAATLISYQYPGADIDLDYLELIIDYISPIGVFTLGYSNDAFASDETGIRYEYGNDFELQEKLSLGIKVGYYDVDDFFAESYPYYNLGLTYSFEKVDVTLAYDGSSSDAEKNFGKAAEDSFVIGASYSF